MAPKRPSPTAQPRWAPKAAAQKPHLRGKRRPELTEEEIQKLSSLMCERFGWDAQPRPFQLEGTRAQLEGTDMIIQAPTGSGKTAVAAGPHVWPSSTGKITIMVCPLLALEDEMVETFKTDFGLDAIAINSSTGTLSRAVVQELLAGKYHIMLISPEMLQSPAFVNRLLRRQSFAKRVLSVVIDEAHCVSHWGSSFRKKYGSIGVIRAFLPKGTPVIAVTATLTGRVRRDLHNVLHIAKGTSRFLNIGNDRPNVSMVVRACQHPQNCYLDLNFVVPSHPASPADIPKSYIYVDNITTGNEIVSHIASLIAKRNPSLPADELVRLVRPFNATMSHEYRTAAMAAFRNNPPAEHTPEPPGEAEQSAEPAPYVRILVCTDAAGMGCNVGDVDMVVQWKLPKTLSSWIQRAGRAARARSRTGLAVLLVERSAYSIDLRADAKKQGAPGSKGKSRAAAPSSIPKDYAAAHGVNRGGTQRNDTLPAEGDLPKVDPEADDEGLVAFVQARTCRRKIWAQVFESQLASPQSGVPCCDICDPTLYDRTRPGGRTTKSKPRMRARGQPDANAQSQLCKWRKKVFLRDLSTSQLDASAILDDATITSLTTVGPLSSAQITTLLQDNWTWWPKYGHELLAVMASLVIVHRPLAKAAAKSATAAAPPAPPPSSAPAQAAPKRSADSEDVQSGAPPTSDTPPQTPAFKRIRLELESVDRAGHSPAPQEPLPPHPTYHPYPPPSPNTHLISPGYSTPAMQRHGPATPHYPYQFSPYPTHYYYPSSHAGPANPSPAYPYHTPASEASPSMGAMTSTPTAPTSYQQAQLTPARHSHSHRPLPTPPYYPTPAPIPAHLRAPGFPVMPVPTAPSGPPMPVEPQYSPSPSLPGPSSYSQMYPGGPRA